MIRSTLTACALALFAIGCGSAQAPAPAASPPRSAAVSATSSMAGRETHLDARSAPVAGASAASSIVWTTSPTSALPPPPAPPPPEIVCSRSMEPTFKDPWKWWASPKTAVTIPQAERALSELAAAIDAKWDVDPAHRKRVHYSGTAAEIFKAVEADIATRDALAQQGLTTLEKLGPGARATYAMLGVLYDAQSWALLVASPTVVVDPVLEAKLEKIDGIAQKILSDPTAPPTAHQQAIQALAISQQIHDDVVAKWTTLRARYVHAFDQAAIDRYARAVVTIDDGSTKFDPWIELARTRLLALEREIGAPAMKCALAAVEKDRPGWSYREGIFATP